MYLGRDHRALHRRPPVRQPLGRARLHSYPDPDRERPPETLRGMPDACRNIAPVFGSCPEAIKLAAYTRRHRPSENPRW